MKSKAFDKQFNDLAKPLSDVLHGPDGLQFGKEAPETASDFMRYTS